MVILVLAAVSSGQSGGIQAAVGRFSRYLSTTPQLSVAIESRLIRGKRVSAQRSLALEAKKGRVRLHWTSAATPSRGRIDWLYDADLKTLKGWDLVRQERLETKGGIVQLLPSVPEEAGLLLVKGSFARFSKGLANLKGWKQVSQGDWVRKAQGTVTEFRFNPATGQLTKFYLKGKASTTDWRFVYRPYVGTPPDGADLWVKVPGFLVPTAYPAYADKKASVIAKRAIGAYDTLQDLHLRVKSQDGTAEIWRSGLTVAQRNSEGFWRYEAGWLKADVASTLYAGKVKGSDVGARLALVGVSQEPLAKAFATRRNFAAGLFQLGLEAKFVGKLGSGEDALELVELDDSQTRTLVAVDGKGRIRQLRTTTVGLDGQVLTRSQRDYDLLASEPVPTAAKGKRKPFPKEPAPTKASSSAG